MEHISRAYTYTQGNRFRLAANWRFNPQASTLLGPKWVTFSILPLFIRRECRGVWTYPEKPYPPNLRGGDSPPKFGRSIIKSTSFTVLFGAHSLNLESEIFTHQIWGGEVLSGRKHGKFLLLLNLLALMPPKKVGVSIGIYSIKRLSYWQWLETPLKTCKNVHGFQARINSVKDQKTF